MLELLVNLCADMWQKSINDFSSFFFNGDEATEALNLDNCETFGNFGSGIAIYENTADGEKIRYSCNVTEIYDIPVILSIYSESGKIFEADYNLLYDEISAIYTH